MTPVEVQLGVFILLTALTWEMGTFFMDVVKIRDSDAMLSRLPLLHLLTTVFLYLLFFNSVLQQTFERVPCPIVSLGVFLFPAAVTGYALRSLVLWIKFRAISRSNRVAEELPLSIGSGDTKKFDLTKKRRKFKTRDFYMYYGVVLAVCAAAAAVDMVSSSGSLSFKGTCNSTTWYYFSLAVVGIHALIAGVATFKTIIKLDAFRLRGEIIAFSCIAVVSLIMYSILYTMEQREYISARTWQPSQLIISICSLFTCFVTIYYPLMAYRDNLEAEHLDIESESKGKSMRDFIQLLRDPRGFKLFKQHVESEFSSENILFLEYYDDLMHICQNEHWSKTKTIVAFRIIYKMYIKPGAELEVNISAPLRRRLQSLFSKKDAALQVEEVHAAFEQVRSSVLHIMYEDSFRRFQHSRIYGNFIQEKDDRKMLTGRMSRMNQKSLRRSLLEN